MTLSGIWSEASNKSPDASESDEVTSTKELEHISRDMRFPTMCHFDMCKTQTSLCSFFLSSEIPNDFQSVA